VSGNNGSHKSKLSHLFLIKKTNKQYIKIKKLMKEFHS